MNFKFYHAFLFFLCIITFNSCVIRQAMPSQNTPCFTNKNQFEGVVSAGIAGANINLAFSPLKHLMVQVNGHSSLTSPGSSIFSNQLEAAIGTYLPLKKIILGFNAGYGQGAVVWNRWYAADSYKEEADHAELDTRKIYSNFYFAYKIPKKEIFTGFGFKVNYLEEYYHLQSTDFEGRYKTGRYGKNFKEYEWCSELA